MNADFQNEFRRQPFPRRNRYAGLDELEGWGDEPSWVGPIDRLFIISKEPGAYTDKDIDTVVRNLQRLLWKRRSTIWTDSNLRDPLTVIDPVVALQQIDYQVSLEEGLGQLQGPGGFSEVAGIIDNSIKTVRLSRQFKSNIRAFTAGHELGHALLHRNMLVAHRDRPLDGTNRSPDPIEREAEKFAARFLMPEKVVRERFREAFGTTCFTLTDDTAFALSRKSLCDVRKDFNDLGDLSKELASTDQFNGNYFIPLSEQFGVSSGAMAIRLNELDLIA